MVAPLGIAISGISRIERSITVPGKKQTDRDVPLPSVESNTPLPSVSVMTPSTVGLSIFSAALHGVSTEDGDDDCEPNTEDAGNPQPRYDST